MPARTSVTCAYYGARRCRLCTLVAVLFNSYIFLFVFLPVTYVVFWRLRSSGSRYVWLAVTGYVFYGYWDPRFCILMAFSTAVSYTAGLGMLRTTDPRRRKLLLVVPITVDLLLLGFFKYTNFVLDSVRVVAESLGHHLPVPALNIVLPVGISFYTFHTITYIVDSYRGVIRPTRNLFEFAAYVSLFSQLVAGPIVRFRQIEEDLENLGHADRHRWLGIGVSYFVVGLLEKVLVADALASFVDPALARYGELSTAGAWLAMLGYSFQLYFDFTGYSSMAIGLGYMFGLRILVNFNSPYKALDPSDFWRRWHISLSSCLRDYLYIPLGGNRHGNARAYRNLMITMLLGGLWHGAGWTFLVWGAYHGLLLCAYRAGSVHWDRVPALARQGAMFLSALVGWVFFRSTTFGMAGQLLRTMFTPTAGVLPDQAAWCVVLVAGAGAWAMAGPNAVDLHRAFEMRPARALALATAFGACLAILAGTGSSPFLYFQF
jgi:alginate O-acetyltransferase complex protein AlgI